MRKTTQVQNMFNKQRKKTILSQYFDRGYDGDMDRDFDQLLSKRRQDNTTTSIDRINNQDYLNKVNKDQKQCQTSNNFRRKHYHHSSSVDNLINKQSINITGLEDYELE